jgi:hypothetical protein
MRSGSQVVIAGNMNNSKMVIGSGIMKGISQDFSFYRLRNDKYTRFQPIENCGLLASIYHLMNL